MLSPPLVGVDTCIYMDLSKLNVHDFLIMKKFEFVSPASSWSCPPKSPTDDNKAANKIFINKKLSGFSENIQSLLFVI